MLLDTRLLSERAGLVVVVAVFDGRFFSTLNPSRIFKRVN